MGCALKLILLCFGEGSSRQAGLIKPVMLPAPRPRKAVRRRRPASLVMVIQRKRHMLLTRAERIRVLRGPRKRDERRGVRE